MKTSAMVQPGQTPNILRRIGARDKSAIKECMDVYGDFVWAIAGKFAHSTEERESVMEQIFADIWRVAREDKDPLPGEKTAIATIALRRLIQNGMVPRNGKLPRGSESSVGEQ